MKRIIPFLLALAYYINGNSQHFYYRMDVGTSNIYSFAVANLATAGLNTLVDDMLFDNAYTYTILSKAEAANGVGLKNYNVAGITARDVFSDVTAGLKLGYQSFRPSSFNWGIYASAHYRINQFKTEWSTQDLYYRHNVQRLSIGGGLFFNLGSIDSSTKLIIEAGVRYETPMKYKGIPNIETKDMVNSGLSSRYSIRVNGNGALQGLGVYAEIPHYKLFKDKGAEAIGTNLRMFTIGVVYTITPWKIRDLYDL